MSDRPRRFTFNCVTNIHGRRLWAGFLLLVAATMAVGPRRADAQDRNEDATLLRSHLEAGEFGPARSLAYRAGTPAERDRWLGEIASAQVASGARDASLSTAADISDDVLRSQVFEHVASEPMRRWLGRGGGAQADWESLEDLITTTIAPETWEELGGDGQIDHFDGGVHVDSAGLLRRIVRQEGTQWLSRLRTTSGKSIGNHDVRRRSDLRMVSLTRLERQVQMSWAVGRAPDEAMRTLAGLEKITYVFVYPETGDLVLAGPASDWKLNLEGRKVSVRTGRPVLRLDDLVVLLRNGIEEQGRFGCSIVPTKQALARTKSYVASNPVPATRREAWLKGLRHHLGKQQIEVYGVDPRTRVARVIVEADYRMKLVGMGLEEGTLGVPSYLQMAKGAGARPMDILRWWFTLNYAAVRATAAHDAFELRGQGVKVLSENELLTAQGERVHTGASDELNREFARNFTTHFKALATKYPVYAELQNVFDLALVAALVRAEDLPGIVGWHLTHFGNPDAYQVQLSVAPSEVDSVINHLTSRVGKRRHFIVGVSGGVSVDTGRLVEPQAIQLDTYGLLKGDRAGATPRDLSREAWWWDVR